jgi:Ca2+-binding EF-hand superfamily protein
MIRLERNMKTMLMATAVLALAPAAFAAKPGDPNAFTRWDSNGDGAVSREEAQAAGAERMARKFDDLDADKDGRLTRDEMHAAHGDRHEKIKERMEEHFKSADKNQDGSISRDEAQQGMPRLAEHFDAVDANKDGLASREELKAHHKEMRHERHERREKPQN